MLNEIMQAMTPMMGDVGSFQTFFQSVLDAVTNKQWWPLASLLIIGFVSASRYFMAKMKGRLGAWLNTDRGGVMLNLIWTMLGAAATTIGAWKAPNMKLLFSSLIVAIGSAGGFNMIKKLMFPSDMDAVDKKQEIVTPPVAVLIPFLLVSGLLMSSCACWKPEHRNDTGCAILHQVIDCSKDAAISNLGPAVAGIVSEFMTGQTNVDWDGVLQRLEATGIKDGGCIIASLENDLLSKASMSPMAGMKAKAASDTLMKFKQHFKQPDLKYCFTVKGMAHQVCR